MSTAHLHLLLNHIPVVGILIGFVVFALGVWRRNDSWTRLALGLFAAVALVAIATMLTGESAEQVVEHLPGVSESLIESHEDAAKLAAIGAYVLGAISMAALGWARGRPLSRALTVMLLPVMLLVTGLMAYTANLGGQIRHTEIRTGGVADGRPAPRTLSTTSTNADRNGRACSFAARA
jgi:uncharacterized membrane protein